MSDHSQFGLCVNIQDLILFEIVEGVAEGVAGVEAADHLN
jgi:hypothetical protein